MSYDRPTAAADAEPVKRDDFFGRVEIPDPEFPGRSRVAYSPRFPFERDVRAWARLMVPKGEVRIWRREFTNGRFVRDVELSLLQGADQA